ncbi:MAG: flavin reductase (DIM6/NTAB) family NADH-FMN oxidoreductase RutF [Parasphingorhabdus sp.]|jgi:flavin reductase (DIM6/NTAB) family NADH-FMN oxidoreductase RutF
MATDIRQLRDAFGTFMTGVTIVTTCTEQGEPIGFTANSFASVSLDPPLLLVCPARSMSSFPVFQATGHFAINVLSEHQQDLSNLFASRQPDRFSGIDWHTDEFGNPLFDNLVAHFSCVTEQRVDAGDHLILIGRVKDFAQNGATGLGYCGSGYFSRQLERRAAELPVSTSKATVGVIIEHDGKVLLCESDQGMHPPGIDAPTRLRSQSAVEDYVANSGLDVSIGPVYSLYENQVDGHVYTYYRACARNDNNGNLGRYVPLQELDSIDYKTSALKVMMKRYALERKSGVFGLYLGYEDQGDVHLFGES